MNLETYSAMVYKWQSLSPEQTATVEKIKNNLLEFIEKKNEIDINSGIYDCSVSVADLINHVFVTFPGELKVLRNELTGSSDVSSFPREEECVIVTQCIREMVESGVIFYIYDKQRVRSRIAELVRYLSYLKQRMDEDYNQSPGLIQMVKLHIKPRMRPERTVPLPKVIHNIFETKNYITLNDSIRVLLKEPNQYESAFKDLKDMICTYFKRNSKDIFLSNFQVEGFREIFNAAISDNFKSNRLSFIIQSGTGSGKTETFLFPVLLYSLLMNKKKGTKALLIYPRIDLCNDQLQRLVRYVLILNTQEKSGFHKLKIGIQHGKTDTISFNCPYPECEGKVAQMGSHGIYVCDHNDTHIIDFIVNKLSTADIIITTPDSLHRRLMDREGKKNIWDGKATLPKFVVFDEAHLYTNQMGMHVANIVKRLRRRIQKGKVEPVFIASSATIGAPALFAKNLFSTEDAIVIKPEERDLVQTGREYVIFLKTTNPRKVTIKKPLTVRKDGESSEQEEDSTTIATNLSAMIQTAFCFYHTMLKMPGKDRIIGFVDSIDIIKRLGEKLCDAESNKQLYRLRIPDQKLDTAFNRQCPHVPCNQLPPNRYINPCKVYSDGECWWVMKPEDCDPSRIHIHKSGTTQDCRGSNVETDDWNMMITTSALEVGFDHSAIIGTFQYMAPMNIPGFVQRLGRGGRSPLDMPIAVVVLGSRPLDSFYFHHNSLLTNPDPSKLEISLDPDNAYVKTMHITSFIYDYISTIGPSEYVERNYYQMDIEETRRIIIQNSQHLIEEITQTFQISDSDASKILKQIYEYLGTWLEKVDSEPDNVPLIEKIRFIRNDRSIEEIKTDILQTIVLLGGKL
ncbi:MAG TPA: DEAD/DEAH box helicase [Atribacter sp.]|uniref:DEAD/DEAH box helicase n=1 Tax=Atribacter sp. TaxID=2847780 RepID=UPI002D0F3FDE|nr:DEAD/DEAH box helicase [Atribacter sp.]HQK82956.1 DEAD/DEAH box helicase [Atribacter sp.]